MSNEYKMLIDRLARARNFKGGSYILLTAAPDEDYVQVAIEGNGHTLATGLVGTMRELLSAADTETQKFLCDELVRLVSDNQMKRFQESGTEDSE